MDKYNTYGDSKMVNDNFESEYGYKEEVVITTGFYQGRKAIINSYDTKTKKYNVTITIKENDRDRKEEITVTTEQIRKLKIGMLGLVKY